MISEVLELYAVAFGLCINLEKSSVRSEERRVGKEC